MDKLVDAYSLPKQNHEETENLSKPIGNEIETVIKCLSSKKNPHGFTGEFYQTFKEKPLLIILQIFKKKKNQRKENALKLMLSGQCCSDTKTRQTYNKKGKLQANISDEQGCKNYQQILANSIQLLIKKVFTMIKWDFILGMQGWLKISK